MKYILAFAFLIIPGSAIAEMRITEIMYDLEGSDSGREWVEVENIGSSSVDITTWVLFENGINHGLVAHQGGDTVPSGAYAVIADNPSKFLLDTPGFTGVLFDSSFSLSNTGESISLKDSDGVIVDTVSYTHEDGAAGDGQSLQKISGTWRAAAPTPGTSGGLDAGSQVEKGASDGGDTAQGISSDTGFQPPDTKRISVDGGPDRILIAGASVLFSADGYGTGGDPLEGDVRYVWVFGDGATEEGRSVLHTFMFPGEYSVVVNVRSGKYNASDYVSVTAEQSALAIVDMVPGTEGYIEIQNGSRETLALSQWLMRTDVGQFIFPQDTRIQGGRRVKFPNRVTGLSPLRVVELLYPNGVVAYRYTPLLNVPNVPQVTRQVASVPVRHVQIRSTVPSEMYAEHEVGSSSSTNTIVDSDVELEEVREAAVVLALPAAAGGHTTTPWLLVLGGCLGLGALALVIIRGGSEEENDAGDIPSLADRITIIEEE